MALQFAEHTATVYLRSETADAVTKIVPVATLDAGAELSCQIQAVGAESILVDQRTGVELRNPYRMMLEPEDIERVEYGALVVWEDTGLQFSVTKKPMQNLANGELADLNHGVAEMELLEFAE